jgi:predicted nucleic acid-binding protein
MKYVLLDTNIFVSDFWMKGNEFKIFLNNFNAISDKLVIPKVIYEEVLSQYKKKTELAKSNLSKYNNELNKYLKNKLDIEKIIDKGLVTSDYKTFFDSKLKEFNVEILDYPNVSHQNIAKKFMERKKPFKEKGDGYCDALIWENIKTLIIKGNFIFFITNNTKDFFNDRNLDRDLLSELIDKELEKNIVPFQNLHLFNNSEILPLLRNAKNIGQMVVNNNLGEIDIHHYLLDFVFDFINSDEKKYLSFFLSEYSGITDLILSEPLEVNNINIESEKIITKEINLIEFTADVEIAVNICASWDNFNNPIIVQLCNDHNEYFDDDYKCFYESIVLNCQFSLVIYNNSFEDFKLELIKINNLLV